MRTLFVLLCLALLAPSCQADSGVHWLLVKSDHFTVYTDGSERQARHTAGQLERMHAVFARILPGVREDAGSSIVVLALRDRKSFQSVEPAEYLTKGALDLAGLFLRGDDRNYILLRLDNNGDHPYETIYHEYTHYMVRHADYMPVWMNEGLAQFYQNTDISDSEIRLGRPDVNQLLYLRQQRLIPLETLFQVDHDSPFYHEQDKGSVFYGESWALTHMIFLEDFHHDEIRLKSYATYLVRGESPLAAAKHAFGDLSTLQMQLQNYVDRGSYQELKMAPLGTVDEKALDVHPVPTFEADAVRADVLARNRRTAEAEKLASEVLAQAPDSPIAAESMGWIKLREGDTQAAGKWYSEAVALHSTSYLAFYYAGILAMQDGRNTPPAAGNDLREAARLNPDFAPALDGVARFDGIRNENLDEGLAMEIRAVQADPGNMTYRLNAAELRVQRKEVPAAISGLTAALKLAHSNDDRTRIQARLDDLQRYQAELTSSQALIAEGKAEMAAETSVPHPSGPATLKDTHGKVLHPVVLREPDHKLPEGPPTGPKHTVSGTMHNIGCFYPKGMTLRVDGTGAPVTLYSNDMYAITYTAGNFTPGKDLDPCRDFDGLKAKITYAGVTDPSVAGQIVTMELNR